MTPRLYFPSEPASPFFCFPYPTCHKDTLWDGLPTRFNPEPLCTLPLREPLPTPLSRSDLPDLTAWRLLVQKVLQEIEAGRLEKVVLARRTTLTFQEPLKPRALLPEGSGSRFLIEFDKEVAFLGCSPEKLYTRKERAILVEALAATRWGNHPFTEKDYREFALVKTGISRSLPVTWEERDREIASGELFHLYNRGRVDEEREFSDEELVTLLHPTPAIGGYPRKEAVEFIYEHEPFERGWYASPLGTHREVIIGIRSALIRGKEMHLFAGAGIVRGSDADKEWEELNRKIGRFL